MCLFVPFCGSLNFKWLSFTERVEYTEGGARGCSEFVETDRRRVACQQLDEFWMLSVALFRTRSQT